MNTKPHFSILATSFAGGPRPRNAAMILSGLWLVLYFAALFAPPLLDDADATHASAARAMASTGDLVTLKVDGVRYLEKAPLPYWFAAASFRTFGFNTFAAHLPQAVAVLLLMLLGHRWANQAFGARTGFYTAIGVLTSVGVFLFTRILIPEVWLALFLGAALFAFLKALGPVASRETQFAPLPEPDMREQPEAREHPDVRERPAVAWYAGPLFYPYVMWASLALAVLSKGLVALLLFFATAGLFLLLTGERKSWRKLQPFSGMLLFFALAAPWHVLAGLRNTGGANGHGFFWFYFWNEHVLRFIGRRLPADYNRLPGWVYWGMHGVWLFPWVLFLPLGVRAVWSRYTHQTRVLTKPARLGRSSFWKMIWIWIAFVLPAVFFKEYLALDWITFTAPILVLFAFGLIAWERTNTGLSASPFHRIDPQQRSILLLSLFAAIVLLFFSLSTNQEYYTFPAYLPILLLLAATITRAEQTYTTSEAARRAIAFAHAALAAVGGIASLALLWGLWSSRHLPYLPDVGEVLAHRGVGSYTLSMSHFFDLTSASFAALRLPAVLAILSLTLGPAAAWMLRAQRRHQAATTAVAFTGAGLLFAAHLALVRFAPVLSSRQFAAKIETLQHQGALAPNTEILLYGDQAFGSSIPFYLGRPVRLVEGRSTSMLFGASFPDAPNVFVTAPELAAEWGHGERKILFVPAEKRADVAQLLDARALVLDQSSGKLLVTDRVLDGDAAR